MALPRTAAWQHREARDGFETVFLEPGRVVGHTSAVEDGEAWAVEYVVELDGWLTRSAHVRSRTVSGVREVTVASDGAGSWRVDGEPAPALDGCLDVDLGAAIFTNALPFHRLGLAVGETAESPAAWVRAPDLSVERLEQRYTRVDDRTYDYVAPALEFESRLVFDEHGLVVEYPGLAVRIA